MGTMRRTAAAALLVLAGGCAHFRVAPENVSSATLQEERHVRIAGWGVQEPLITPTNCSGQGMATVMVTIRPRDTFIAIVTLGIVRPAVVEWTCAKERNGGAR
jgi:hypothetical protein